MSVTRFSKGPWHLDRYGNIVQEGSRDARDCIRAGGLALTVNEGEPMYNRHLIACAPEMYEMLESIIAAYEMDWDDTEKVIKLLAKARGEK